MPIGTVNQLSLPMIPYQRFQFSFVNQRVFGDEKIEMLVTSVDVSLGADGHQLVEVVDVDVDENSEQSGQDFLTGRPEIVGEGNVHSHWNCREKNMGDAAMRYEDVNVYVNAYRAKFNNRLEGFAN